MPALVTGESVPSSRGAPKRVSVIVPIYNRYAMLEQLILSVRNQTYPDVELVVIDDGSTDLSPETFWLLVRRVAPQMVVQYEKQPNQGVSVARNRGLDLCSGAYVYFLDSDDLVMPWALATLVDTLECSGGAVAIASVLDSDFDLRKGRLTQPLAFVSMLDHYWYIHSALYDVEMVKTIGGFREGISIGEDLLFNLMVRLQKPQINFTPKVIGVRRLHGFGHLHERGFAHDEWRFYLREISGILTQNPELKREPRLKRFWLGLQLLYKSSKLNPQNRSDILAAVACAGEVLLHDLRLTRLISSKAFHLNGGAWLAAARGAIACCVAMRSFFRSFVQPKDNSAETAQAFLDHLRESLRLENHSEPGHGVTGYDRPDGSVI